MNTELATSHQILAPDHIVVLVVLAIALVVYGVIRRKKK